ncbi:RodZ family helix-turn-helix domain-containing protein [Polynucleobacter sp. Fuers-14]|uniref:helix-turn-helix domain-containing protein n=1 Tax=Polynucleobacter sp. Fuers-14 TaxID=1758364 RepID=UPI001C0C47AF|nr:helix-turn-helix domain-containing protein [Polynucleobacter sp. Fuers-14]MBU3641712.1 helix-turn-helix domain-containing protein [Polynucleobacter sp. Fuers-14]
MTSIDSPKNIKSLGKQLREARESQGHNLAILAGQCNLSVVQLTAIERGDSLPFSRSQLNLYKAIKTYAKVLKVDIEPSNLVANLAEDDIYIPEFLRKK